ncbi:MAG: riboflavin synthase [Chloroflexi bacterium]|nr:riboflavin synthase [Chloroflexota bacterium]
MFTGLIEEVGRVQALRREAEAVSLDVAASKVLEDLRQGDSIAVDGTCLTVVHLSEGGFTVGLSPETLRRTNLGERVAGDAVNLERALAVGGRMGGHYVQGHVDGVGRIVGRRQEGDSLAMTLAAPSELLRYIVAKGFIAVDGISLTVTERVDNRFSVALVAYTQSAVALPHKPDGSTVNLEVDIVAKYVESLLGVLSPES